MVQEVNTVRKKLRRGIARVAYVFPSLYEVALSSVAYHMIYYLVNESYDEVYLERFVLQRLSGDEPEPRSLDTLSPLRDFNLIISSIHYEPDYVNLIRMLIAAGIEPLRRSRRNNPIIVVGGPAPMANPAPVEEIADVIAVGEIERLIPTLINNYLEYIDEPHRFLERLSDVRGFYVPGYNDFSERVWESDLDNSYYPIKQVQSLEKEPIYGRGLLVESSRGCPLWCRFCMETRLFKPYRYRSLSTLKNIIEKGLQINNLSRVIIYALYFPSRNERHLLEYLYSNGIRASLPSMRLDLIDDDVLELVKGIGQHTITIAPENVSDYGIKILGKGFSRHDLGEKPFEIIRRGFDIKAYFIIGIKGETLDDVKENVDYIRRLAKEARSRGKNISVTINPLVPKPRTPFQWIGMIDLEKAKRIIAYVRRELRGVVDTRPLHINWAWIQASIALAGKEITKTLIVWAREGGDLGGWRRAIKITSYDTRYVFEGYRVGSRLPWDNVVLGFDIEKIALREYEAVKNIIRKDH